MRHDIIKRYEGSPILTSNDIPFPCNTVFNCGVAKVRDRYVMLLRIELRNGRSRFGIAWSADGYRFEVQDKLE